MWQRPPGSGAMSSWISPWRRTSGCSISAPTHVWLTSTFLTLIQPLTFLIALLDSTPKIIVVVWHPVLKTWLNRIYDFQKALCENPVVIGAWFRLVQNMRAKYGILDCDFYNFDEEGFMMGIICAAMVVTHTDWRGRGKTAQPDNRE